MSHFLARSIADRLSQRPAYCVAPYVDPRLAAAFDDFRSGSSLAADLREIATSTPESREEATTMARNEIMSAYGMVESATDKPFIFQDGIAVIPIHGLLINRFNYSWGFVTGYNFIRTQLRAAAQDDDVKLIVYDVNSHGGITHGLQETVDEMFAARADKPSLAMVDAMSFSAGYWLASAASKVICTPSGNVGSIGAIIVHMSVEKMLEKEGIDVTMIFSGAHKADGWPYKDLTKDMKTRFQASVDEARQTFAASVARNRDLKVEEVLATEALSYNAIDAQAIGLIDAIETPSKAVATFFDLLADDEPDDNDEDEDTMATSQNPAASAKTTENATEQANATATATAATPAVPAVPAAAPSASADLTSQIAAAISADRQRSAAIRNCEEAAGRETLASTLADQGMSLEQAKIILNAAPKATAPVEGKQGNPFAAAMNAGQHPNIGAGTAEQTQNGQVQNRGKVMADRMFARKVAIAAA